MQGLYFGSNLRPYLDMCGPLNGLYGLCMAPLCPGLLWVESQAALIEAAHTL